MTDDTIHELKPSLTLLRSIPMFSGVPDEQLEPLMRVAKYQQAARHTHIVRAGENTNSLYVIVSGGAKVLHTDNEGREVILDLLGPGEFFGEMTMIDGATRSADVVTNEPCHLLMLTQAEFKKCLAENFDLCLNIMKGLVQRLREANQKIESLALMDVRDRVAKLLLDFSEEVDGQRLVRRKLTQQDMAKMIGSSREMVSRVMKDLEHQGAIRVTGRQITLLPNPAVPS